MQNFYFFILLMVPVSLHALTITLTSGDDYVVMAGDTLEFSASNNDGAVTWTVDGQRQAIGPVFPYQAPFTPGTYQLDVQDGSDSFTADIIVQARFVKDNANWRIITDRSHIQAITVSSDGKILWIGTQGGLEKRDGESGRLLRLFITGDGLPGLDISALAVQQEHLWIGTGEDGIAYLKSNGLVQALTGLPKKRIKALLANKDGVWVGFNDAATGLLYLDKACAIGKIEEIEKNEEENEVQVDIAHCKNTVPVAGVVNALAFSEEGGLWIGTAGNGLSYLPPHAGTPNDFASLTGGMTIKALLSDGENGIWAGGEGGLLHIMTDGTLEASHPGAFYSLYSLAYDAHGTLWAGTNNGVLEISTNRFLATGFLVTTLLSHDENRLWLGSHGEGLQLLNTQSENREAHSPIPTLPGNSLRALLSDSGGNLWIGGDGLVRMQRQEGQAGIEETFENIGPPVKIVDLATALAGDGNDGVWARNIDEVWAGNIDSISHFDADGNWLEDLDVQGTVAAMMPSAHPQGLYIGTDAGLFFRRESSGEVIDMTNVLNGDNGLASRNIVSLLDDGANGLWVAAGIDDTLAAGGLAHLRFVADNSYPQWEIDGETRPFDFEFSKNIRLYHDRQEHRRWAVTQTEFLKLEAQGRIDPFFTDFFLEDPPTAVLTDSAGDFWIGTADGLVHLTLTDGSKVVYKTDDGLPHNKITALAADGDYAVWVATAGGLAHLSFGRKAEICKLYPQSCDDKYAAIIIYTLGEVSDGTLSTNEGHFIVSHAYETLNLYGYGNDDIYLLSQYRDLLLGNDQVVDSALVDAPGKGNLLSVDEVAQAFDRIKQSRGWLKGQPLVVLYVGHGRENELPLEDGNLSADRFNSILTEYQDATENPVVVILEACKSGSLVDELKRKDRVIITSADAGRLAHYHESNKLSFGKKFFDHLKGNNSFYKAFEETTKDLEDEAKVFYEMQPVLEDMHHDHSLADSLCLIDCEIKSLPDNPPPSECTIPINECAVFHDDLPARVELPCVVKEGRVYDYTLYVESSPINLRFTAHNNRPLSECYVAYEKCAVHEPDFLYVNCVEVEAETVWAKLSRVPEEDNLLELRDPLQDLGPGIWKE